MKSKNLIYTEDQEIAILPTEDSLETICQNDSSKALIRGKKILLSARSNPIIKW